MEQRPASHSQADAGFDIHIRDLAPDELHAAAFTLAEGVRDNPLHVKASAPIRIAGKGDCWVFLGTWLPTCGRTARCLALVRTILVCNSPAGVFRIGRRDSASATMRG